MTHRERAPHGVPCWTDLWTSDVEGSRRFYAELFGWEALEPNAEFGGYFMWTRDGVPIAGGMGGYGDVEAQNVWQAYLAADDIAKVVEVAQANGAQLISEAMPITDLGIQAILTDPTGASIGVWQPGTFSGFTTLDEPGTPSWFELHTRDYAKALDFYTTTFGWETSVVGDTDDFRYSVLRNPAGAGELAGVMDSSSFLPEGQPSHWGIYWHVDDVRGLAARVEALGGSVVHQAEDTPYGVLAVVTDPAGAQFRLRTPPG